MGILKVEIDLSDLYFETQDGDCEINFTEIVKNEIIYRVKAATYKSFEEKTLPLFQNELRTKIDEYANNKILAYIDSLFVKPEIKKSYYDSNKVSAKEYIEEFFEKYHANESIFHRKVSEMVDLKAKNLSDELKNRYDQLFASQIVGKLNEKGFLKEDIAKLLLGDKNSQ